MNCSATLASLLIGGLLTFAHGAIASGEEAAELDDAAARMQYAFYTADVRSIEESLRRLEGLDTSTRLAAVRDYQLAYGSWKLAQLYAGSGASGARSQAGKAAQRCVRHARGAVEQDAMLAEAHAIAAVCEGFSSEAGGSSACARNGSLRTAQSLAPSNPRVRLIEALCSSGRSGDPAAADRWRAVVESFEAAPPSRPGKPDWGHVEALTLLGEAYLQRGERIAARDALERALVLAPDFRYAQQLLQQAATRPR